MPQYFANSFAPMTPIGAGLQNIAMALFGGRTPRETEMEEAKRENLIAQSLYHQAHAREAQAKATAEEQALQGRKGFLDAEVGRIVGQDNAPAVQNWMKTRSWGTDTLPAREDPAQQMTLMPQTVARPTPAFWTPEVQNQVMRAAQLWNAMMATGGKNNVDNVAQASGRLQKEQMGDAVVAGRISPTQHADFLSKETNKIDEGYQINPFDTNQAPIELGIARALIDQRNAAANASNAHAGKFNAERDEITSGRKGEKEAKKQWVKDKDGNALFLTEAEIAAAATGTYTPHDRVAERQKTGKQIKIGIKERAVLEAAVADIGNRLLGTEDLKLSQDARAALLGAAERHFSDPNSEGYGMPDAAAEMAINDLGGRAALAAPRRMFGIRDPKNITVNPQAATAKAAPAAPGKDAAPAAGRTPEQIRAEYKAGKISKDEAVKQIKALGYGG